MDNRMQLPTKLVVKWHGKLLVRFATNEDDNVEKAAELRRTRMGKRMGRTWLSRYAHRLIPTRNTREGDGLLTLGNEIEYRDWNWLLTSMFYPSEYHARPPSEFVEAPWCIMVRCFMADLPSQVTDDAEPIPWKRHPVGPLMPVSWVSFDHDYLPKDPSWGYRAVFSQEVQETGSLTGPWLVTVYIAAKDRKWLAKADERTLVTMENLFRRVKENCSVSMCAIPQSTNMRFSQQVECT